MLTKVGGRLSLALLLLMVGCNETAEPTGPVILTEEELATSSFERIVAEINRKLDREKGKMISEPGGPTAVWTTTVTEELIRPLSEGLAWRAKITVVSKNKVTVISLPEDEDEGEKTAKKKSSLSTDDLLGDAADQVPGEFEGVFDELSQASSEPRRSSGVSVHDLDGDKRQSYKLIFEDGRWRLTTPLEDDKNPMYWIFRVALKAQ